MTGVFRLAPIHVFSDLRSSPLILMLSVFKMRNFSSPSINVASLRDKSSLVPFPGSKTADDYFIVLILDHHHWTPSLSLILIRHISSTCSEIYPIMFWQQVSTYTQLHVWNVYNMSKTHRVIWAHTLSWQLLHQSHFPHSELFLIAFKVRSDVNHPRTLTRPNPAVNPSYPCEFDIHIHLVCSAGPLVRSDGVSLNRFETFFLYKSVFCYQKMCCIAFCWLFRSCGSSIRYCIYPYFINRSDARLATVSPKFWCRYKIYSWLILLASMADRNQLMSLMSLKRYL